MKNDWSENLMMLVGNLVLFGAIWYAVFILGHSGWWFAFLLLWHFSRSKEDKEDENGSN